MGPCQGHSLPFPVSRLLSVQLLQGWNKDIHHNPGFSQRNPYGALHSTLGCPPPADISPLQGPTSFFYYAHICGILFSVPPQADSVSLWQFRSLFQSPNPGLPPPFFHLSPFTFHSFSGCIPHYAHLSVTVTAIYGYHPLFTAYPAIQNPFTKAIRYSSHCENLPVSQLSGTTVIGGIEDFQSLEPDEIV